MKGSQASQASPPQTVYVPPFWYFYRIILFYVKFNLDVLLMVIKRKAEVFGLHLVCTIPRLNHIIATLQTNVGITVLENIGPFLFILMDFLIIHSLCYSLNNYDKLMARCVVKVFSDCHKTFIAGSKFSYLPIRRKFTVNMYCLNQNSQIFFIFIFINLYLYR